MTLISHHPHSRYFLLEKPGAYPGLDIIHNTPDGPVIDLGVDMDNKFGVGYIQVRDIQEMARVLGYITPEEANAKDARIAELEAQVNRVPSKIENFTNELRTTVDRFISNLSDDDSAPVDHPETYTKQIGSGTDSPIDAGQSDSDFDGIEFGGFGEDDSDSGQTDDDVIDEGPNELSGDSGDELLFGFSSDD